MGTLSSLPDSRSRSWPFARGTASGRICTRHRGITALSIGGLRPVSPKQILEIGLARGGTHKVVARAI
jgi:hypothetical protein